MLKKTITLKDISEKLNLTQTTISKALRGHPDISQVTRNLVMQVADELGYVPNAHASILSSRKSRTIGLILPYIADTYLSAITERIYKKAQSNGFEVSLAITCNDAQKEEVLIRKMLANKVEAIVVYLSGNPRIKNIRELVSKFDIPLIFIIAQKDASDDVISISECKTPDEIRTVVKSLGYEKINVITTNADWSTGTINNPFGSNHSSIQFMYCRDMDESYYYTQKIIKEIEIPEVFVIDSYSAGIGIVKARIENPETQNNSDILYIDGESREILLIPQNSWDKLLIENNSSEIEVYFGLLESETQPLKKIG